MTIIVMLDDNGGMVFNHRRQSQDAVLRLRVLEHTAGQKLWMNSYSARQFAKEPQENLVVDDDFLANADENAICFVENVPTAEYLPKIDRIVVYHWNREYPGDQFFDISLTGWKLERSEEFSGKSHERITEEVYIK